MHRRTLVSDDEDGYASTASTRSARQQQQQQQQQPSTIRASYQIVSVDERNGVEHEADDHDHAAGDDHDDLDGALMNGEKFKPDRVRSDRGSSTSCSSYLRCLLLLVCLLLALIAGRLTGDIDVLQVLSLRSQQQPAAITSSFSSSLCNATVCVPSPHGDLPACCFASHQASPSLSSYHTLPSYNLCPLPHERYPFELNPDFPANGDKYKHHWPTIRDEKNQLRLIIFETLYHYMHGQFMLLSVLIHLNPAGQAYEDNYWPKYWKDQLNAMRPHLSCRFQMEDGRHIGVPLDAHIAFGLQTIFLHCPWPLHPIPPPTDSLSFDLFVDYDWKGDFLTPIPAADVPTLIDSTIPPLPLHICPVKRPVVEVAWCNKGMRGELAGISLFESILYHRSIGISRFMVWDADGLHYEMLRPLVEAGLMDYNHSPSFIPNQHHDFLQNIHYDICRSRYWHSARVIAYTDFDEFLTFNQPGLLNWQNQRYPNAPGVKGSIVDVGDFVKQVQNMPNNRGSWMIGINMHECIAFQMDPEHTNSKLQVMRFPWCNRYYQQTKHIERSHLDCDTGEHRLGCRNGHLVVEFERMDQAMIVHYRSAIGQRDQPSPATDITVWVSGQREAVFNNNSGLVHLLKPWE